MACARSSSGCGRCGIRLSRIGALIRGAEPCHIGNVPGVILVVGMESGATQATGQDEWLGARFEDHRSELRAVAYRMLGSVTEADDAVQDAWLRVSRAGGDAVENLGAWFTTIVARVCLNK